MLGPLKELQREETLDFDLVLANGLGQGMF